MFAGGLSRFRRVLRGTLFAVYCAGATFALLCVVELVAMQVAPRRGFESRPFLYDRTARSPARAGILQVGATQKMSYLDPHLGHAHEHVVDLELSPDGALPGFVTYGKASSTVFRIVTSGGSTTDPLDEHNWTRVLHQRLAAAGVDAVVFNGGVSGYSTNQELLKLIRDALPLAPDLVISLSGINDLGFLHSLGSHPMVHPYQKRMLDHIVAGMRPFLLPNTLGLIRGSLSGRYRVEGVNYGPEVDTTPWEQWERNIRLMRAVSSEMRVEFVAFLQPVLGVGDYIPNPGESALLKEAASMGHRTYIEKLHAFYDNARPSCARLDFCVDLVDLFAGRSGLYRDARHPSREGYRLIAVAMEDELRDRGVLPEPADA